MKTKKLTKQQKGGKGVARIRGTIHMKKIGRAGALKRWAKERSLGNKIK